MIDTYVLKSNGNAPSPLDALDFDAPLRHRDAALLAELDAISL
jgi:hypothetical protein